MARERHRLGQPFGVDGPWLAAILDVLGDIQDLLDERLPRAGDANDGGPVRISEPAPAGPPPNVMPVSEPAPDDLGEDDAEQVSEPAPDLPEPPPRAGRGSSLSAWQIWAASAGVAVDGDMTRDQIISACVSAGVLSDS